jgi:hypothetical protein
VALLRRQATCEYDDEAAARYSDAGTHGLAIQITRTLGRNSDRVRDD